MPRTTRADATIVTIAEQEWEGGYRVTMEELDRWWTVWLHFDLDDTDSRCIHQGASKPDAWPAYNAACATLNFTEVAN
jgi:hypothetical protein